MRRRFYPKWWLKVAGFWSKYDEPPDYVPEEAASGPDPAAPRGALLLGTNLVVALAAALLGHRHARKQHATTEGRGAYAAVVAPATAPATVASRPQRYGSAEESKPFRAELEL